MLQRPVHPALSTLRYALILLVVLFAAFPIFWMILTSFKPAADIMVSPPRLFFTPTLENYVHAIVDKDFLRYVTNTLIVSVISTVFVVVLRTLQHGRRPHPVLHPVHQDVPGHRRGAPLLPDLS
jgi:multiple sugar transport system permease protein